ncbi:hypothetical protein [Candidatus Methanoperedens nitratireducens]|uniref:Uncharacterized protein n=1 Tax=Candidatus Methanoperedens nitratireducens TaxID=1392998 RepID=A0A284VLF1_9EURY|nr:hypothetical protein [Candidatus Methanoperedens nitroreducens]SNQ60094.1 hypothetical protein MNV_160015 [Candidatus Methanoperedens nitroreducens]
MKEQDAPAGSPEHENDTGFEAPDVSVAVALVDMLLPCTTEPFDGLKDREKLNGTETGMTVRLYFAFLVMLPPAPLTVIEYVPAGVEAEVDIVSVEELVGYKEDGLNEQDAPAGSPEHENDTGFEAPDTIVAVAVVDVLSP